MLTCLILITLCFVENEHVVKKLLAVQLRSVAWWPKSRMRLDRVSSPRQSREVPREALSREAVFIVVHTNVLVSFSSRVPRLQRFSDHVTKINESSGDENGLFTFIQRGTGAARGMGGVTQSFFNERDCLGRMETLTPFTSCHIDVDRCSKEKLVVDPIWINAQTRSMNSPHCLLSYHNML